jgi:hypothetical protein
VATFTPTARLSGSTTYTMTVSGVTDAGGNVLATPVSWSFTTAVAPTVTARTPASGATNISRSTAITATFNEDVLSSSISFVLKDQAGNTVAGVLSYNSTTHVATFTPSSRLKATQTYTVTISGVTDSVGNVMVAPLTWSFTTGAA